MAEKQQGMLVCMKAASGRAQEWLETFKKRADHVHATEPGCLAYGALVNKEDPDEILIYERYENNAAVEKHQKAPEQKELNDTFLAKKLTAARVYQGFGTDFGPGFWPQGRANDKGGDKGTMAMIIHMHCAGGDPKDFNTNWASLTDYVKKSEPNTLAYQSMTIRKIASNKGFETEGKDFIIFEQYVADKDLDETHMKSEPFKNFNRSFKGSNLKLEPKFQKKYTFSGVGFLSLEGGLGGGGSSKI